ncbi:electron transport complex subunit E [Ferrimonas balearica]|nr:electron transport complex subunit E [Ferrimonas balearica]MBW3163066.1 electron transport complex subunit E [Ferrimonas balearica]MBY5980759.1 electron transport complex subunit E [Ferrimonas balearica]MBY6106412.1 electron transport complex subunit E [Ferrimonas balearica]MBY6223011.1 electron transport complex subunit E [Ferrimonas balearica]
MSQFREIAWQGLWKNNPGIVQLLGLCPLLAVTNTLTNAMGLGLATLVVLVSSNVLVSLLRKGIPNEIRIPVYVMIIAALVTCVQLLVNAYAYGLYLSLGIFLPLIVTNCVIIGRAEAFASKNPVGAAALDGLMMGTGFMLVLMILGGTRELIGQGTLFDGADQLLGDWASVLRIQVMHLDSPFLLALLPPGAFIAMGLLIALKNVLNEKLEARVKPADKAVEKVERVRVTQ